LFHRTKAGAQQRYYQFVRDGLDEPSPWTQVRGQIFLGTKGFLANMAELVKKQSLMNVPKAQTQPSRLTGEEVLAQVGQVYGLPPHEVLSRAYPAAYHCAAWLLRRIANEPLREVAKRFGVSPSRISHIQRVLETHGLSRQQAQAQKLCKAKQ